MTPCGILWLLVWLLILINLWLAGSVIVFYLMLLISSALSINLTLHSLSLLDRNCFTRILSIIVRPLVWFLKWVWLKSLWMKFRFPMRMRPQLELNLSIWKKQKSLNGWTHLLRMTKSLTLLLGLIWRLNILWLSLLVLLWMRLLWLLLDPQLLLLMILSFLLDNPYLSLSTNWLNSRMQNLWRIGIRGWRRT